MATNVKIGTFRGYSDSSTSYGYYFIYFGYDSITRNAASVTFNNARVWGQQQGNGFTTNTIYLDQFALNDQNMSVSWSGKGSDNSSWSTTRKNMTVTGIGTGTTSIAAKFWMHRSGQSWGAQNNANSPAGITIPKASLWNDINAFNPNKSAQNGLIFNLTTSDGGSWSNITNEPSDFTKPQGTTATISNIRSNITGAHYSGNNVTNNAASSFTWTFNTADWACELYTAWNTHTITIRRGTGIADITSPDWAWTNGYKTGTVTYGQSFNINVSLATGYHWGNWTGSFTTTTQNYTFTIGDQDYDITANGIPNTYTIAYNANGGNNPPSNQRKTYNSNLTLSSSIPTRSNYDFLGWSTSSTATSATYSAGQVLSTDLSSAQDAIVTLYAVWRESRPSNLVITGTVNGPFEIDLSWSAIGLYCNYVVYANGTQIYSGANTSFTYSCAEETTYNIYFTATNAGGTTTSSTISLTTPADQAKIRIKQDGVWKKGKTYYKKDGQWVKAKKIYIKVDGQWKINNNYDS